ncbi:hypothetical protein J6590_103610 [Homalodisca vitripennis]|nr:hypothetical protein J6590_103610 [Homalodisca vitripennis]
MCSRNQSKAINQQSTSRQGRVSISSLPVINIKYSLQSAEIRVNRPQRDNGVSAFNNGHQQPCSCRQQWTTAAVFQPLAMDTSSGVSTISNGHQQPCSSRQQ